MKINMQIYSPFDGKVCIYRRFNAIVSQLKISLFWVIYIIQKPRYCCVGRRKFATLHALFGN